MEHPTNHCEVCRETIGGDICCCPNEEDTKPQHQQEATMTNDEAFAKIMKAADQYAETCRWNEITQERGTCRREIETASERVPKSRWELEQMIRAALFSVTKV